MALTVSDQELQQAIQTIIADRSPTPQPADHPLAKQEGGDHYKSLAIQPVEFIHANKLGYIEGAVVKYVARHRAKNGAEDLRKAIHFLELLLHLEYGEKGQR